jgi:hypothetical protein
MKRKKKFLVFLSFLLYCGFVAGSGLGASLGFFEFVGMFFWEGCSGLLVGFGEFVELGCFGAGLGG